jgi:phospholipase/carboxylesterase
MITLKASLAVMTASLLVACSESTAPPPGGNNGGGDPSSRLTARPGVPTGAVQKGRTLLGLGGLRDGFMYLPQSYNSANPIPLVVALHGSTSSSAFWVQYEPRAEARGFAILAPDSRSGTWDIAEGSLGPDIAFIDRALKHVFERVNVDPSRIVLLGFSDGASYAISIGVSNGDLFNHLNLHFARFAGPDPSGHHHTRPDRPELRAG